MQSTWALGETHNLALKEALPLGREADRLDHRLGDRDDRLDLVPPQLSQPRCSLLSPWRHGDGPVRELDDPDVVFMSEFLSLRDRLGGDVEITIDDDRTLFSAVASVKPA